MVLIQRATFELFLFEENGSKVMLQFFPAKSSNHSVQAYLTRQRNCVSDERKFKAKKRNTMDGSTRFQCKMFGEARELGAGCRRQSGSGHSRCFVSFIVSLLFYALYLLKRPWPIVDASRKSQCMF